MSAAVGGEEVSEHPDIGSAQRVEQAGDRLIVTGGGVVHDMRCDGTLENGVHDAAFAYICDRKVTKYSPPLCPEPYKHARI